MSADCKKLGLLHRFCNLSGAEFKDFRSKVMALKPFAFSVHKSGADSCSNSPGAFDHSLTKGVLYPGHGIAA
jgi:hypothetical protein